MTRSIVIKAAFDREAGVWYIEHSSLPGLHLETETPIELYGKLSGAIEDLLEGQGKQEVSFEFIALLDHLVGAAEYCDGEGDAERLSGGWNRISLCECNDLGNPAYKESVGAYHECPGLLLCQSRKSRIDVAWGGCIQDKQS